MEYTIKIKLTSGKEIELTKEELEQLLKSQINVQPVYPIVQPFVYREVNPYNQNYFFLPDGYRVTCQSFLTGLIKDENAN